MRRAIGWLCAMTACAIAAGPARAQLGGAELRGAPFAVTADAVDYEPARDLYTARGSVVVRQEGRSIRADWMAFSPSSGRGVASGNVVFEDGEDRLFASFVEFETGSLEGVIFDGRFDAPGRGFRMEGDEIAKTGEDTYRFENGMFTTCRCPDEDDRDPWQIRAGEADLEVGGYGTARNTTFEVLGIPIVWLPWMIYPIKTERQTGLLFPEIGLGTRNGYEVGLPFFWAVADPLNFTFTPRWMSKRGVKGDVDAEFVAGEESEGELHGAFVYDDEIDENSIAEPFDRERWAIWGQQDFHLPADVRFKTELAFTSDNDYAVDFQDLESKRRDRFVESQAFASRPFGRDGQLGLIGSAVWADDIQSPDDLDRDRYLLQRLPRVELRDLPAPVPFGPLSWLVPAFDAEYTWFEARESASGELGADRLAGDLFLDTGIDAQPDTRNGASFERDPRTGLPAAMDPSGDDFDALANPRGPEGNGRFDEGEPLVDRGHRIRLTPRLAVPRRLFDVVELYPEVGWHQTLYQTNERGFDQRGFLTALVDVGTQLRGGIGDVVHLLEPHVGYALVTHVGQSGNPLFVPATAVPQERLRQLELASVVLDPADRVPDANAVTVSLENRFFGRVASHGSLRLLGDVALSSRYDIEEDGFGPLYLDGRVYPLPGTTARLGFGFDPEETRVSEALLQLGWSSAAGHQLGLRYRYVREVPRFFEDFRYNDSRFDNFDGRFDRVHQAGASLRWALSERWSLRYAVNYSFERSLLLSNRASIEYLSRCRCWAAGIELRQDRAGGVSAKLLYRVVGLGNDAELRPVDAAGGFLDALGGV